MTCKLYRRILLIFDTSGLICRAQRHQQPSSKLAFILLYCDYQLHDLAKTERSASSAAKMVAWEVWTGCQRRRSMLHHSIAVLRLLASIDTCHGVSYLANGFGW